MLATLPEVSSRWLQLFHALGEGLGISVPEFALAREARERNDVFRTVALPRDPSAERKTFPLAQTAVFGQ
jgi:hypothetical protein